MHEFAHMLVLTPYSVQVSFHKLVLEKLLYPYLTKILVQRPRKEGKEGYEL